MFILLKWIGFLWEKGSTRSGWNQRGIGSSSINPTKIWVWSMRIVHHKTSNWGGHLLNEKIGSMSKNHKINIILPYHLAKK